MAVQTIPARIRWAVDFMEVQPNDHVLEIGCGSGHAADLICRRLEGKGKMFAIDRSEAGVDRTRQRCAAHVEAGRLTVRQIDLATLRVPVKRLTKVFAFNVNLFWVRDCKNEVALLHERVLPGGSVNLFFDATRPDQVQEILTNASRALTDGGFRVYIATSDKPPVVGIIGRR
ncbi:class I SAM-dependent methyltransferase [Nocardioides sp. TF02-7]|uniref:class I SAM-dependent methyltransferase n=1 Tax=Nocardioides sp. TF02-7 TaxID=2917724 RepID=UPI001F070FA8|nr:class I SAM-dependent methyltransferase [Nocardioides sp. TF02-7]UMG92029.1 class I SAM-dependent methyltransferase [Nocardioides sp. TF02-7]